MPEEPSFIVIDAIDQQAGIAEVEFSQGFSGELPLWWLPLAAEGAAYTVSRTEGGLRFSLFEGGAGLLREKSKQALLDFSDEFSGDEVGGDESSEAPESRH